MGRIGTIISRPVREVGASGRVEAAAPIGGAGTVDDPLVLMVDTAGNGGDNLLEVTPEGLTVDSGAVLSVARGELVTDPFGVELGYLVRKNEP